MSNRRRPRWHRKNKRTQIPEAGPVVQIPQEPEVQVIKEVPAVHTGMSHGEHAGEKVQVGIAILHDDGSVALQYDEDAPLWAMEEIQAFADKIHYSLGRGEFTDGAP